MTNAKNSQFETILLGCRASFAFTLLSSTLIFSTPALSVGKKIGQPTEKALQSQIQLFPQSTAKIFRGAIAKWEEKLSLFLYSKVAKADNISEQAEGFLYIGNVYSDLEENQLAIENYNQALQLFRQIGNISGEASALTGLGNIHRNLKINKLAIENYNQALPLFRQINNSGGEAIALMGLAIVYRNLGENRLAVENYNQALPLFREIDDIDREAEVLTGIGDVYKNLGENRLAVENYNQALPLFREIDDIDREAEVLTGIGDAYRNSGEKKLAQEYYKQALPLLRQIGNLPGEAIVLTSLGHTYSNLGEKKLAQEYYKQALPLFRQTGDRREQATNLYNIASIKYSQGHLIESLPIIEESLAIVEDIRTKFDSPELRTSYFASVQDRYKFYIKLLMELHQQQPKQGFDAKAFHASERSRARTLLELLTEAGVNIRQGVDSQLVRREQDLQKQLHVIEKRRIELLSGEYTPEQKAKIEKTRDKLIDLYEQLRTRIRTTSPNYATLTQPQPFTVRQVQQQVLDDETLLLQYSLGKTHSYLWAITKDSIHSYQLPPQAKIKAAAIELMIAMTNRLERNDIIKIDNATDNLTEIILQPVADKLNKKRLLIVADDLLQYIPFAALSQPGTTTESNSYQPLIVNHEIVNLPSATTIATIRSETKSRKLAPKKVAIIADPVFSPSDARVTGETITASTTESRSRAFPPEAQQIDRAARDAGIKWDRLPGTRTEAEAILAIVPENERIYSFDFEANRNIATSEELSRYQIVHFATHGFANSKQPELSGIVMSLVDRNGNWQNGFLRLNDIFNLNLPAELVVLSACKTAWGKDIKGEGLVGLTRGFMYAGSKRVVGSLWHVDDVATAELMSQFYQGMLEQGLSPVEALRDSQLQMWQQNQISPYYWAAFTLQGEWQ